jgi:hypothetical protein
MTTAKRILATLATLSTLLVAAPAFAHETGRPEAGYRVETQRRSYDWRWSRRRERRHRRRAYPFTQRGQFLRYW